MTVYSSAPPAIIVWISLIREMTLPISSIAVTAEPTSAWIA
jgi:hypothetical protein